ncbi:MAG TPA: SigE family RNA polymerase sigma factor [Mycobacteriales bacterium]|nr:SigE family RNA polymerase sigma factor [Mycobacteriales bacterium]
MDAAGERAFGEFVQDKSMGLYRTAYLIAGDAHHAEDLLQSALEKACRRWKRIGAMEHPEAYVRRIIVNLATDRWRGRRYVTELPLDEEVVAGSAEPDPTTLVDLRYGLAAALRRLPVAMRTVLVLRYWEGLPEAEVAAELGCSVGSVKSQASRGLVRLRGLVSPWAGLPRPAPSAAPSPGRRKRLSTMENR